MHVPLSPSNVIATGHKWRWDCASRRYGNVTEALVERNGT